jgi:hypothetical protein
MTANPSESDRPAGSGPESEAGEPGPAASGQARVGTVPGSSPQAAPELRTELVRKLFVEHNRALLSFLTARLRSPAEARDVAQEACDAGYSRRGVRGRQPVPCAS